MHGSLRWMTVCTGLAFTAWIAAVETAPTRSLVLDNVRIIDGGGGAPIEHGRIVIERDPDGPEIALSRLEAGSPYEG